MDKLESELMGTSHGDERDNVTKKRNDHSARACAGPRHSAAIAGSRLTHCGMIQDIIDKLNEGGSNTELRLLANRLQRLAFRVRPQ